MIWKKNCSLYRVHKVLYTECQGWPWPLTPWPKISRVPPLIIHNSHMKIESDWAKTEVFIVSIRFYTECRNWPWPLTPWPKFNRVPPLISHNLHVKFESDWVKTVVAIVSTSLSVTDPRTHPQIHSLTHPTTHERPRYYIPSNSVARG